MQQENLPHQRVLSLWFPELACDRILRPLRRAAPSRARGAEPPFAVTAKMRKAQRLTGINATARALGIRLGEPLADVRARVPHLLVEEADPELDLGLLALIADWCDRYTPLVALDGTDGLFLDMTGCAHLFGGEEAMLADVLTRLQGQGFAVCGAIAGTPGAAWAVARFGDGGCVPEGGLEDALRALPLPALRLAEETVEALGTVGLKTIGDILQRPRAPLARRYGAELILRLDQALGHQGEPVSPRFVMPVVMAERRFFEPIARIEDVRAVALSLGQQVCEALERRVEGGRAFELALFRVDGAVQKMIVGTSRPLRLPKRILALFSEKLKADESVLDAGFGYDLVRLSVLEAQADAPDQLSLSGRGQTETDADLAGLIDRLGARLGLARVGRLLPVDRHVPESQCALVPAATVREDALSWVGLAGNDLGLGPGLAEGPEQGFDSEDPTWQDLPLERPLRLINPAEPVETVAMVPDGPPLRFRWRRVLYKVVRSEGPERIAPPWWVGAADASADGAAATRDYFRIEDEDGRRFWLYREGLYAQETREPRWFLQGVFA
ncbi:DNA polymerase Y family protein [Roseibium sp. RKSG952]|uniref:Y-family DNA polymerase n=1 Tax=Roseibium sp. RKSG952 TaxID=2529384 RepID=UPI0012BBB1E7|nr:DNA polymerase Y family protein [Roseibium sp. RKSG952]MTH98084.1 DNA polymerase Y family protein [Roseibium sp. RKSG952]